MRERSTVVARSVTPRASDTTPAGGDMGAHVWGPAYLRDVLLPSGRLSGWTADWYAGFFPPGDEAGRYRAIGDATPDYLFEPR